MMIKNPSLVDVWWCSHSLQPCPHLYVSPYINRTYVHQSIATLSCVHVHATHAIFFTSSFFFFALFLPPLKGFFTAGIGWYRPARPSCAAPVCQHNGGWAAGMGHGSGSGRWWHTFKFTVSSWQ